MFRVFLFALLLSGCAVSCYGQAVAGSICAKYVSPSDTGANELALITAVVTRAALGGPFPSASNPQYVIDGIVQRPTTSGNANPIYGYFDSSIYFRANQPNYTANGFNNSNWASLTTHLFSYFGALLGCMPASSGWNSPVANSDMYGVHQNMGLNQTHMNYFITAVALSMESFGVTSSDVATMVAPALSVFQRCGGYITGNTGGISATARNQICDAPGPTACNNATVQQCQLYTTPQSGAPSTSSLSIVIGLSAAAFAIASTLLF